ncbi:MAG: efflux RND transporter periplasmic adaptor subunit [Sulfurospirillaceae bacterium]|nr:efflux RND transporter periplasmic adaptor subunit [Sulfurospirillaceae bacterium]MDD2826399.1 efflux RND transporter periplasmic adaptor subunit [Sulfurospirillaceae bacterium]
MTTKRIIINIGASLLILGIGFLVSQKLLTTAPQAPKQKQITTGTIIETINIAPSTQPIIIQTIGSIEASASTIISAKVAGRIIEINPNFLLGGIVKKGDVLVQIDKTDYHAALNQAKAALLSAKAALQIELGQQASAKKELELSTMQPTELSKSLVLREPQLEQAKATILQYEAAYEIAQNNLNETTVKAPYDGVITKKSSELGSYVTNQSTIAEVVATNTFWIKANIPLSYLKFLNTMDEQDLSKLPITLLDKNESLHVSAKIIKLLPELDNITKQAQLLIAIKDPLNLHHSKEMNRTILLGDTLSVHIQGKRYENIFAMPSSLLRANSTVWVMTDKNELSIKPVHVLYKNNQSILIDEGLTPNDKIITTYLTAPVEGMKVVELSSFKKSKKAD